MPKIFGHIVSFEPVDGVGDVYEGKEFTEVAANILGRREKIKVLVEEIKQGRSLLLQVNNPRLKTFVKIDVVDDGFSGSLLSVTYLAPNKGVAFLLTKIYFSIVSKGRMEEAQKNLDKLFIKK